MSPTVTALPDGELRIFEPDENQGDLGRMYVLDVLGRSILIRERTNAMYVGIDHDAVSLEPASAVNKALAVEVNNSGETFYE